MARRARLASHVVVVLCGCGIWVSSLVMQDLLWTGVCRWWGCMASDLSIGIWRALFAIASGGLLILAWIVVAAGGRGWRAMAVWVVVSGVVLWALFYVDTLDILFTITLSTTIAGGLAVMAIARRVLGR